MPQKTKLFFIATLLLILLSLLWYWYFSSSPVQEIVGGNDRFGLGFITGPNHPANETRYRGALATGARWDRWPLYWHWVDEGGYEGTHSGSTHDYDTLVAQELSYGFTPVVILLGTPARHVKAKKTLDEVPPSRQESNTPQSNNLPAVADAVTRPPASLQEPIFADGTDVTGPDKKINPANAWANFVFTTVERYRPDGVLARQQGWPPAVGIRYWEVWNEPDFHAFWRGTAEEYYRLLEVAYKSIKAADPDATVILGGLIFYDQREWFPTLLKQAQGQPAYFDVFSFHHYLSIYRSEHLLKQTRTILDEHGLANVPIWVTESGVSVWDDYPATAHGITPTMPHRATMIEQAAFVIQNSALAFYSGVQRYYHYMLHDDCGDAPGDAYGLRQNFSPHVCAPAQGQPRPAYAAYQLAAEQFRDLSPLWREKQAEQDRVAFYRPDDQSRLVVLWATQGVTVTTTLSATGTGAQLTWVEATPALSATAGLSRTLTLTPTNGLYTLTLPPATNQNNSDPGDLSYQIGGPPIIVVEKDTQPPHTQFQPLPSMSVANFIVQWQGQDVGSGIVGYDVYVSENNKPLQLWLENTDQIEAEYAGQINHTYGFAVRARDRAGNEEPPPVYPQVTTRVISGSAVSGLVLSPNGEPVANATVSITGPNIREMVVTKDDGAWLPLSLPPGEYNVQAHASGYSSWPAPQRVILNNAPLTVTTTVAPLTNAIVSGDFEGNQVWSTWQWAGQVNLSNDRFDGETAVRLGNGAGDTNSLDTSKACPEDQPGQRWVLSQQVTIPDAPAPFLSFLYKASTSHISAPEAWLEVLLLINDQPYYLFTPTELPSTPDWTLAFQDLSAWQGQTANLQFRLQSCSEQSFSITLDRVSLGNAGNQ